MKKSVLIGIAALAVVSLWLVFTFGHDSSVLSPSLATPAYAGGATIESCTDACLYDVEVVEQLPIMQNCCKISLGVKHKEQSGQCCCHAADYILVQIATTSGCTCDVDWICDWYSHGGVGQVCEYDEYRTPLFAVPNNTQFYYTIWDSAAPSTCKVTGSYQLNCY